MNRTTSKHTRLGTALGAFALVLAAGCGTDVATAPAQLPGPEAPEPAAPTQECHGSPQQGGFVCRDDLEPKGPRGPASQGGLARPGSGPGGWY
jgi:hypothetical protein